MHAQSGEPAATAARSSAPCEELAHRAGCLGSLHRRLRYTQCTEQHPREVFFVSGTYVGETGKDLMRPMYVEHVRPPAQGKSAVLFLFGSRFIRAGQNLPLMMPKRFQHRSDHRATRRIALRCAQRDRTQPTCTPPASGCSRLKMTRHRGSLAELDAACCLPLNALAVERAKLDERIGQRSGTQQMQHRFIDLVGQVSKEAFHIGTNDASVGDIASCGP